MKLNSIFKTALGLAAFSLPASAAVTVTVVPSIGPSKDSPNFETYATNAANALLGNVSSYGMAGTPAYYERLTGAAPVNNIVTTTINSWYGEANPAAPFDGEFGNALYFGLQVVGDTAADLFSLTGVELSVSSDDPAFNLAPQYLTGDYSAWRIGVLYGDDGALGGGDDTYITSGSGDTLVNAFFYVGVGGYLYVDEADPVAFEDIIDQYIAESTPTEVVGGYVVEDEDGDVIGSGSGAAVVPEPSVSLLAIFGLGGLVIRRRR